MKFSNSHSNISLPHKNLEEVNKRRSELIEVKILLALLYMIIDEKKKAFKNIEGALSYDTSNYKIKELYDEIKCDLSYNSKSLLNLK